jgi:hypothetical protein
MMYSTPPGKASITKGAIGEFLSYFSASTIGPPTTAKPLDEDELLELDDELELLELEEEELLDDDELELLLELDDEELLEDDELEPLPPLLPVEPPQAARVNAKVEASNRLESRLK